MHGACIMLKNATGWTPLAEAVSYGDRQLSESSMSSWLILLGVFVSESQFSCLLTVLTHLTCHTNDWRNQQDFMKSDGVFLFMQGFVYWGIAVPSCFDAVSGFHSQWFCFVNNPNTNDFLNLNFFFSLPNFYILFAVKLLLRRLKTQNRDALESRRPNLVAALRKVSFLPCRVLLSMIFF